MESSGSDTHRMFHVHVSCMYVTRVRVLLVLHTLACPSTVPLAFTQLRPPS